MDKTTLVLTIWITFSAFLCAYIKKPSNIEDGHYHTKYDDVNIDDVYSHRRLVHHYVRCLINRGPCPPETADLKHDLGEMLETNCAFCTEKQVHIILVSIQRIRGDHPAMWKQLTRIYDPNDIYVPKFEEKHDPNYYSVDQANLLRRSAT